METETINPDTAWTAFSARDRSFDGRFVVAVTSTGIYCKPSCPARHPKRENVRFYRDPADARAGASAPVCAASRTRWGATASPLPAPSR